MGDMFLSEYLHLDDELEELGVFDSIINRDSPFFINILRLKQAHSPEFAGSYQKINQYFANIMILLTHSNEKGDRFYREALHSFRFSGVKGINLGFSETGVDAGFGKKLSKKVIDDAFDIVKTGSHQPEIFHLVGLFEENVAADRLSDMIATLIREDIRDYTRRINIQLGLGYYSDIQLRDGIAINPYKGCELLYLPKEILHEIPIAKCWDDIDRVISENKAIRNEINEAVGREWADIYSSQKKAYLKNYIFKDPERCARVIDAYREEELGAYEPHSNFEYFIADTFKKIKKSGVFNFLEHSDKKEISSWDASLKVLDIFRSWVEDNKGWDEIISRSTSMREKSVQRLLHLSGKQFCDDNNIDMSFEPNEGPGPVDIKISRGCDKTVMEIKLSSNPDYLHGFEEQIEKYARAEGTDQRIFVYVQIEDHPGRDKRIQEEYEKRRSRGENPPFLYMIDSRVQKSASLR